MSINLGILISYTHLSNGSAAAKTASSWRRSTYENGMQLDLLHSVVCGTPFQHGYVLPRRRIHGALETCSNNPNHPPRLHLGADPCEGEARVRVSFAASPWMNPVGAERSSHFRCAAESLARSSQRCRLDYTSVGADSPGGTPTYQGALPVLAVPCVGGLSSFLYLLLPLAHG